MPKYVRLSPKSRTGLELRRYKDHRLVITYTKKYVCPFGHTDYLTGKFIPFDETIHGDDYVLEDNPENRVLIEMAYKSRQEEILEEVDRGTWVEIHESEYEDFKNWCKGGDEYGRFDL